MLDIPIHPAHHVALERREQRLAVALEGQRAWLVQAVDRRLAEPTAERSTHEPLQLDPARRAHAQEVLQARVSLVGLNACALEIGCLQQTLAAYGESAPERAKPLARMLLGRLGDIGGDVALGVAQADEEVHRGLGHSDIA